MSEFDVYRRQIPMSKVDPRAVMVLTKAVITITYSASFRRFFSQLSTDFRGILQGIFSNPHQMFIA